ncbi:MAG TPA: hypothetical protein VGM52_06745, partial [Herbaspirillum sp.]
AVRLPCLHFSYYWPFEYILFKIKTVKSIVYYKKIMEQENGAGLWLFRNTLEGLTQYSIHR